MKSCRKQKEYTEEMFPLIAIVLFVGMAKIPMHMQYSGALYRRKCEN